MKLAALFSGGKDSTFSLYQAKKEGHQIECLITLFPLSEESTLFHFPNIELTKLQSQSMNLPQISIRTKSLDTKMEDQLLRKILKKAKDDYKIEGMVQGGISSEYQKKHFENVCSSLDLCLVSPVWKIDPKKYMNILLGAEFRFIVVSVSSDGLDDSWLGKEITPSEVITLENLSKKYGFNLNFEGGEAETFVLDCPLFSYPIKIKKSRKIWDGYRGRLEIEEADLDYKAKRGY